MWGRSSPSAEVSPPVGVSPSAALTAYPQARKRSSSSREMMPCGRDCAREPGSGAPAKTVWTRRMAWHIPPGVSCRSASRRLAVIPGRGEVARSTMGSAQGTDAETTNARPDLCASSMAVSRAAPRASISSGVIGPCRNTASAAASSASRSSAVASVPASKGR